MRSQWFGIIPQILGADKSLLTITLQNLSCVEWQALEGVDGNEDGTGPCVDFSTKVPFTDCMEDGRFVKVGEGDHVVIHPLGNVCLG